MKKSKIRDDFLLLMALLLGITILIVLSVRQKKSPSVSAETTPVQETGTIMPDETLQADISSSVPAAETEAPPAVTTPREIYVETKPTAVTDDFFADAAFLGNSLMVGFQTYSGLSYGDYYATVSASIFSADTLLYGLYEKQYGKIYVELGINEIGYGTDSFRGAYGGMLDQIIAAQPGADVYILAITPVTQNKSASDPYFNMPRIAEYNQLLYGLAEEKGCYYIDLCAGLVDESGFLPAYASGDGIHLTPDYYTVWLNYLREHYIITPTPEQPQAPETPVNEGSSAPAPEQPVGQQ